MTFYFPDQLRATPYEKVYRCLRPLERLMLLREFVGVTYRRRFLFFKNQAFHQQAPSAFRRNLTLAAAQRFRHLRVSRRVWRQAEIRRPYLRLVFRHFLFGFLVQSLRFPALLARLPAPSWECYYDFFPNLAAMLWYNRRRSACQALIESLIDEVEALGENRYYVYALLLISRFRTLFNLDESSAAVLVDLFHQHSQPGATPLGVELEFSNLGRFATFDKPFKGGLSDPLFRNMQYYEAYYLDDVSWRLGGYLDTHIRGRSLLSLPRIGAQPGGFYEYSLVRIDYPRSFSMPLSRDPGLVALYIEEICDFISEIKPHSLHLNLEKTFFGAARPELGDYLCLLLLGGDLALDDSGAWREKRLADNELRGVIQRRKHRPAAGIKAKEVVEFAFLRLWRRGEREYGYFPVLMAFKGFLHGYNIDLSCRDQVQGMLAWAHQPRPLAEAEINRFVENLEKGWVNEGAHAAACCRQQAGDIHALLQRLNRQLV